MRIAYVTETYPPELNGVALGVERTVTHLREQGHELDLLRPAQRHEATGPAGPWQWLSAGCPIPVYPDLRFGMATSAVLQRRLREQRAQLVHVATPGPLAWAAVHAARRLGLGLSSDFRTNFHQYSRYYGLGLLAPALQGGLRRLHNLTQRTFVPTRSVQRELAAAGFLRLQRLGRGVDAEQFSPRWRSEELRREWQAREAPVLLYVGRLAAEKNVGLALRTHAALRHLRPDIRMVVVGDGPQRAALQRRFPGVRFMGVQRGEALSRCYASADVFLFPSQSDTFGNVTLEAMASGLAVLAFDTAAAGDLIASGVNGFLAPPGDETAFVDEAVRFIAPPQTLDELRRRARLAAQQQSWPTVLGHFEAALSQVLEAQRIRARMAAIDRAPRPAGTLGGPPRGRR